MVFFLIYRDIVLITCLRSYENVVMAVGSSLPITFFPPLYLCSFIIGFAFSLVHFFYKSIPSLLHFRSFLCFSVEDLLIPSPFHPCLNSDRSVSATAQRYRSPLSESLVYLVAPTGWLVSPPARTLPLSCGQIKPETDCAFSSKPRTLFVRIAQCLFSKLCLIFTDYHSLT